MVSTRKLIDTAMVRSRIGFSRKLSDLDAGHKKCLEAARVVWESTTLDDSFPALKRWA